MLPLTAREKLLPNDLNFLPELILAALNLDDLSAGKVDGCAGR